MSELTLLGKSGVTEPTELLEKFDRPDNVVDVTMSSDEVTGLCPVTGQPDQYVVEITYAPDLYCIESKSLKLKLQSYRNKGLFCEALSDEICQHVFLSIKPFSVSVVVKQKPRGGVSIEASSEIVRGNEDE